MRSYLIAEVIRKDINALYSGDSFMKAEYLKKFVLVVTLLSQWSNFSPFQDI